VKGGVDITINADSENERKVQLPANTISTITEHIGYWRKANAIHHWLTKDNEDDTKTEVSYEQLLELKEDCEKVIKSLESQEIIEKEIDDYWNENKKITINTWPNTELALKLLPPHKGFFFGSYNIDEWYLQDLKDTVEIIDNIKNDENSWFVYTASY
jgi:hypothetical protein